MRVFIWIMVMNVFCVSFSYAQAGSYYDAATIMGHYSNTPDPNDKAAVVKSFQAQFIKTVFLKPVFDESARVSDGSSSSSSLAGHGIYNEMMMQHLAEHLAENDVLNMKSMLEQELGSE